MVKRKKDEHTAHIALGSNLGHREKNMSAALNALQATREIEVVKVSGIYETQPVGGPASQGPFLNAVAKITTALTPKRLLSVCLRIEKSLGRARSKEAIAWGPRTIDLDILFYDDEILSTSDLTIPHPLLHERRFVLEPLVEVSPNVVHPAFDQTAKELLAALDQR